jgi:histidinol-phosphate phosphatase family protein
MIRNLKLTGIRGIILDRDGVINKKRIGNDGSKYVLHPEDLEIYEDFYDLCTWADANEFPVYVATNQQCLGLGLILEEQLVRIHEKIQTSLNSRNLPLIKKFYVCGHLAGTCGCRKTSPDLIHQRLEDTKLWSNEILFFGDSFSDLEAANSAGVAFIQVKRGQVQFANSAIQNFSDLSELEVTK